VENEIMEANNGKRKFQLSILKFTTTKSADSSCSKLDFIDLTIENDLSTMVDSIILCPICNVDITSIYPTARDRHVELCLLRDTTVPEVAAKKVKLLPLEKHRNSYMNTSGRDVKTDKFESKLSEVKIEATSAEVATSSNLDIIKCESVDPFSEIKMEETISIDTTDTSSSTQLELPVIEPPKSVNPSRRRLPIPRLKILSFPVDSTNYYEISVDAFNFAPHNTIKQYILTHFHSDHYGGISKKWSYERVFEDDDYSNHEKYRRIIYCTKITGRLLTLRFKVDPRFIMAM
jgi:DNA cross-link repair 1A protein